ncbi:flavodoxin family protein [Psychrobium sp. 1_MG-2023]|uniref:flavodoxin family protein n=1 Tax=Psychrobium sp. 1_MG-2023 TaxID=3062624 RepID=UPI000C3263DD|nr:NAD(P)H-dependent oxidoreductase [Psychrobium sp. 1_MG-2023]MDP2562665.1 NAD(P)H-dependent oxidoreductase [Psychrobium sp. 1_MG-2023]PKF53806.1 FMN reductase [Alteromonadales bacterium alter-6D02]
MRTVIILASARQGGNTALLSDVVKNNIQADVLDLSDYAIAPFDYEFGNGGDDFIGLIDNVLTYDHVVFATPVYWYTMSAQMKVFFDRLADLLFVEKERGRAFKDKACSVLATGHSEVPADCFEPPFILSAEYLGMRYQGMLYCSCPDGFVKADHQTTIADFIELTFHA